jgi:hypothetical protein
VTNNRTGKTTRVTQGSGGGTAVTRRGPGADSGAVRTGSGDVYAGRDGNVYRKQDGGWQQYGDGGWSNVNRPENAPTRDGSRTGTAGTRDVSGTTTRDRAASPTTYGGGSTYDQLNRDSRARAEGQQRTRDYSSYQGGRSSGASYRGGGGMRGGGGRRR